MTRHVKRKRVIYNEDGTGIKLAPPGQAKAFLRGWVDRIASRIPIDTYTVCSALPDLCWYRSKVGEVFGSRFEQATDPHDITLRELFREGTDPLEVYIEKAREYGMEILAEVRMSDTHHQRISADEVRCPRITLDHPEWVIKRSEALPQGIQETAMDYSYPEVRDYRLGIITELVNEYDVDGLELNFIRWGKHFHRDEGPSKTEIMTTFVGQIVESLQQVARKRGGRSLRLSTRVPGSLVECRNVGLDPRTWVENDWIDYLTVGDYNFTDPHLPIEEFADFTQGTGCRLFFQMGDMIGGAHRGKPDVRPERAGACLPTQGYISALNTKAEARGAALNAYSQGAEGVSFWNITCSMGDNTDDEHKQRMLGWVEQVIDPEQIRVADKRYHFFPLWKRDQIPPSNHRCLDDGKSVFGGAQTQVLTFHDDELKQRKVYRFRMADGKDSQTLSGTLRFRLFHCGPEDKIAIDINSVPIDDEQVHRVHDASDPDLSWTWFEMRLEDCPDFRGKNELGITWVHRASGDGPVPHMEELDIHVEAPSR